MAPKRKQEQPPPSRRRIAGPPSRAAARPRSAAFIAGGRRFLVGRPKPAVAVGSTASAAAEQHGPLSSGPLTSGPLLPSVPLTRSRSRNPTTTTTHFLAAAASSSPLPPTWDSPAASIGLSTHFAGHRDLTEHPLLPWDTSPSTAGHQDLTGHLLLLLLLPADTSATPTGQQQLLCTPGSLCLLWQDLCCDESECVAQVTSLAMRGSPVLVVDFEHLLTNIDLAVKVANDRSSLYMWLRSAVRAFFSEECSEMNIEGMEEFIEGACVSFINKPEEVFSLTDARAKKAGLVKVLKIIHGQETCTSASASGRELFLAILIYVLGRHKAGQSWDGNFCEEDVYFFRYPGRLLECRILKSISPGRCTATARKKDLGTVDSIMIPCYEDADGNLPVLFDGLHDDLKNSLPADVVEEWFMENLEFDLALMPPGARKILVLAVSNAIKSLKLSSLPGYSNILRRREYRSDWRHTIRKDKGLLGGVYWFENKERDEAKDQYKATMESAVGYERNTHEHGHQHLDGEKRLDDFDEGELLIAMKQSKVLRKLVKDLMRLNMMGGALAAAREIYCKSRAIQNEPATALPGTQSGDS